MASGCSTSCLGRGPIKHFRSNWIPRLAKEKSAEGLQFRARLQEIEAIVSLVDDLATQFLAGSTLTKLGLKALVGAAKVVRKKKKAP